MSESRTLYRGRIIRLDIDTVTLPDGRTFEMEMVRHPGGAAVVALDRDQRVCLLRQFRHAAGGWVWELPAGKRDNDEPYLQTAQRELAEEAGLSGDRWDALGRIWSSPGVFDEIIHLYLARELTTVAAAPGAHEFMEVHWLPFSEALAEAASGQILDGKTVAGLFRAERFLQTR